MRQVCAEAVVVVGLLQCAQGSTDLPEMLATGGSDQAIDCVVLILGGRCHNLVVEVDGLLRMIADGGNITDRIVRVGKVLKLCGVRRTHRTQTRQPKGLFIVFVIGRRAVSIIDLQSLALRVITYSRHERSHWY